MSDQYVKLEEERRQKERAEKKKKEKKKRKEKRSSRGRKHDSGPESEEDITPAHQVDIVTEEMPEVRLSHFIHSFYLYFIKQYLKEKKGYYGKPDIQNRVCLHLGCRHYSVCDVCVISTSYPAVLITFQDSLQLRSLSPVIVFQNALPSDDDDKDPNDPHKALDIDLDK